MAALRPSLVLALVLGVGSLAARAQDVDEPPTKKPPPTPVEDASDAEEPPGDGKAEAKGGDVKGGGGDAAEAGDGEAPPAAPKPFAVGDALPSELTLVPFPLNPPEPSPEGTVEAAAEPSSLAELVAAGEGPLVLLFWSGRCPVARRYGDVYRALVEDLGNARFAVVCPNAGENHDETRKALAAAHLAVPTFLDPEQRTSDRLRVAVTPTALVFDSAGTLRYRGPLDDDRRAKDTERVEYLRAAIEAVLAGKKVETTEPRAFGSSLRR